EALLEDDRDVAPRTGGGLPDPCELLERGAQRLVGQHMGAGVQGGDGCGGALGVDARHQRDVDVVRGQQLLRRRVQRHLEIPQEALAQRGVGFGGADELELLAEGDLGQGVVDVLVRGTEDRDLHGSSSRVIVRPVAAAVVRASSRRTVAAPSRPVIEGARPAASAVSTSSHCWTCPAMPIALGSEAPTPMASSGGARCGAGSPSTSQRRISPWPTSTTPRSQWSASVAGLPGGVAVEVLSRPSAPDAKRRVPTVVSSAAVAWARVPCCAVTDSTGPASQVSRSTLCTPWFSREPPLPASPRQAAAS